MSDNQDKESLNRLANELNLPYTLVSTTDDQRQLRKRLAFARRLYAAGQAPSGAPSKITVAKAYYAAYRLHDDIGKVLGYLGGTLETIGDYAHDLKQIAPIIANAADVQLQAARHIAGEVWMGEDLSEEEKGYLGKVLGKSITSSKHYVVAGLADFSAPVPLLVSNEKPWVDVADAWVSASVEQCSGRYAAALLPKELADRVADSVDDAVRIDVTQLDPRDRRAVASRLSAELDANPDDVYRAVTRAFI